MVSDNASGALCPLESLLVRNLLQHIFVVVRGCHTNVYVIAQFLFDVFWKLLPLFVVKQKKVVHRIVLGYEKLPKLVPVCHEKLCFVLDLLVEIDADAHRERGDDLHFLWSGLPPGILLLKEANTNSR